MRKSRKQLAWEKELQEIYKEEIEDGTLVWEQIIEWYPTREEMIEQDLWLKEHRKNSDLYNNLRLKFDDENDFELFKINAIKDTSILEKYVQKEDIKSFQDFIKMRGLDTSGKAKLINYFKDLIKGKDFQDQVQKLRIKYKIPENGFDFIKENEDLFSTNSEFYADINNLRNSYALFSRNWYSLFKHYVVFNRSDLRELPYFYLDFDLCKIDSIEFDSEKSTLQDLEFPIMIKISPYASGRDIVDFIKKNSKIIEQKQKEYRSNDIKIGKIKKKKSTIQERNDFIYQNRHLKLREIMTKLGDKFGKKQVIDVGYIGKILSTEKKKRKDV